jgi:D-amino-acid dehydrogenase
MPGIWKSVPKWLLDPDHLVGPLDYLPRFLPWAIRFICAGQADHMPAIADAMSAVNRPSVDLYRHQLRGTGEENRVRDWLYVHVYRDPAGIDLH